MCLEEADEMLGIVESEASAYHSAGKGVIIQQLLGMGGQMVGNDVLVGTSCLCLHQCTENAWKGHFLRQRVTQLYVPTACVANEEANTLNETEILPPSYK